MASTKPALLICRPDSPIGASGVRVGVAEGDEREDSESELPHAIRERETEVFHKVVDREHRRLVLALHESRLARFQRWDETDECPEDLLAIQTSCRPGSEQLGGGGAGEGEHRVRDELQSSRAPETADEVDLAQTLKDRPRLREILLRACDEHGQSPGVDGRNAPDHRRLENSQPARPRLAAELLDAL